MDVFTLAVWVFTIVFLVFSFVKDKVKTKQALKMAFGMGKGMLSSILSIIFAIGLILTIIPPAEIAKFLSEQSVILATIGGAFLGEYSELAEPPILLR